MASLDSFDCERELTVGSKTYTYFDLTVAEVNGLTGISKLPRSLKVLLENLLRHEDGKTVKKEDIQAMASWLKTRKSSHEIAYRPARVLISQAFQRLLTSPRCATRWKLLAPMLRKLIR
jgi:aconitate hydratase